MKTGSLRTVALGCGLALVVAAAAGCASKRPVPRDVGVTTALKDKFGFSGRRLAVDLGQTGPVRLVPGASQLQGGFLVLLEEPNRITALDRNDLLPEWAYHGLPGSLRYAPTLSTTSMLLMSGSQLHQVDLRFGHAQGPAIHFDLVPSAAFAGTAGTAFVPSWGGSRGEKTLRTLNLVTGLEGWGYRTPGDIRGGIVVGGQPPRQTVYFATDSGEVYGLPAAEADGQAPDPSWVAKTHGPVTAALTLEGEDLFAASQDGFLYCMDRVTGTIRWAAPHETPLLIAPAATKGSVYQYRTGWLWCHDRATGAVRWKIQGALRFVVERDGKALVADGEGNLLAVDGKGAVVGTMASGGLYFPTNVSDGSLFGVGADGFVYKLEVGGE